MADANIGFGGVNQFGVNAAFKTQSSGWTNALTDSRATDEEGNVLFDDNFEDITNYFQNMVYCGTDFVANFGHHLTAFGQVRNSRAITGITINMAAGEYVTVTIEGHQHEYYLTLHTSVNNSDVSDFLPHGVGESFEAWDGFGVPDFGVRLGTSSPVSATVTFSMDHADISSPTGRHFLGESFTPKCELEMQFSGIPTDNTKSEIESSLSSMYSPLVNSIFREDSNTAFINFGFTVHAYTDIV